MHWLIHFLGIDTQQSDNYDFWSGVGPVLFAQFNIPLMIIALVHFRHKNCHVAWCWRVGRYPWGAWMVCKKHHPSAPPKEMT